MRLTINFKLLVLIIVCGLLWGVAAIFVPKIAAYLAFFIGFLAFAQVIQKADTMLDAFVTGLFLDGAGLLAASAIALIVGTLMHWTNQSIRVTVNIIWFGGVFIMGSWLCVGLVSRLIQRAIRNKA